VAQGKILILFLKNHMKHDPLDPHIPAMARYRETVIPPVAREQDMGDFPDQVSK
jgi:hypothetical protein